jgi:hypothetical protein
MCPESGHYVKPEMMLAMLRTAFLAYVRVLLCLQGMYLMFLGVGGSFSFAGLKHGVVWMPSIFTLIVIPGLAGIVTAVLLRRGRRWAAIAAILIEALWAAAAAWIGYDSLMSWPPDWQFVWKLSAAGALFLVTIAGLLLRPVRVYTGLVRR